jgi:Flp pilus assembly protein TadB
MSETSDTITADLRERRQRANEDMERHLERAKASLRKMGYNVVPQASNRRRPGVYIGYVVLVSVSALAVAGLIASIGVGLLAFRWLVSLL